MAIEIANLAGLSQAGAPVMTRGSTTSPTSVATSAASITTPTKVSGRSRRQAQWRARRGVVTRRQGAGSAPPIGPLPVGTVTEAIESSSRSWPRAVDPLPGGSGGLIAAVVTRYRAIPSRRLHGRYQAVAG